MSIEGGSFGEITGSPDSTPRVERRGRPKGSSYENRVLLNGARMREIREEVGLSQIEVARRAEVTSPLASFLENGQMAGTNKEIVARLARVLGEAWVTSQITIIVPPKP